MSQTYISIMQSGRGTYEEKKSVFLGFAVPVSTEEEALLRLSEIKDKYPDARHHVYAYVLRENNKLRYSDDGEPSGTGGMPVLDSLRKAGITDTLVVVVRYFGGILLGTGGLVRAYTAAAKAAIADAKPVEYRPMTRVELSVGYADHRKISSLLAKQVIEETLFAESVTVRIRIDDLRLSDFRESVTTQTGGRCVMTQLEHIFSYENTCEKK